MTTTSPAALYDLTTACTLAIAAGTASDYACRAVNGSNNAEVAKALNKISLRFAELALEALGGDAGQGTSDETASA